MVSQPKSHDDNLLNDFVIASNINLREHAFMLINLGMFDAEGGRYSGMLASLQASLEGANITASYYLSPDVGIVFYTEHKGKASLSIYVHRKQRGKGMARALMERFGHYFDDIPLSSNLKIQAPTDRLAQAYLGWQISNDVA
jgi:GNAT superfamily N-acetyltransferase